MDGCGMELQVVMNVVQDVVKEKLDSGKNLNHCNNWNVVICFLGKKVYVPKIEQKIDIKIFYHVRFFFYFFILIFFVHKF